MKSYHSDKSLVDILPLKVSGEALGDGNVTRDVKKKHSAILLKGVQNQVLDKIDNLEGIYSFEGYYPRISHGMVLEDEDRVMTWDRV